ncbi:tubulin folding cofactor D [Ceratobasidium sp. AG-Ba]|nr:tubulin folding cofactor D [Ceratobasidium sp. AG-Ba]
MDETVADDIQPSGFEHEKEFMQVLRSFLDDDSQDVHNTAVANEKQPFLLDQYLGNMVEPVVESLKKEIRSIVKQDDVPEDKLNRLQQLATLMYLYSKTRGTKSIVSFFPHTVQDLPLALEFTEREAKMLSESAAWALRFVMTLWLSLICMIPFDLARFDESGASPDRLVSARLDAIGKQYLRYPGIERESAAMLLARLYMRTDMLTRVPHLVEWSIGRIQGGDANTFEAIGLMQVMAIMMKSGGAGLAGPYVEQFRELINAVESTSASKNLLSENLMKDTLVRKFRIKLIVRLSLCELPGKPRKVQLQNRRLIIRNDNEDATDDTSEEYDAPIPDSIEGVIEDLINGIQDQDTAVRYSAAKGIARVASRLPEAFSDEILDAVTALFSIHGVQLDDGTLDLPPTSEGTWHGACLAYAELARRGLISESKLEEAIKWICKALAFDVRKGAHSVGSGVRDSASYVLWALVRAQSVEVLKPYLLEIALRLTITALFDREVHVRRAASAAYQEAVGRTGSIPHGIDVLRATDFYAVSIRRNAFLTASPQVAVFPEYRQPLIDHVMKVVLRHWDPKIRELGAHALRVMCGAVDMRELGAKTASQLSSRLRSMDTNDVHGALLGLAEMAKGFKEHGLEEERLQCFKHLCILPSSSYQKFRGDLIVEGACLLVAEGVSVEALAQQSTGEVPDWRHIVIESGMKHQNETVQIAATLALAAISQLIDCTSEVRAFAKEFQAKHASPTTQCSISRAFGALAYDKFQNGLDEAVDCLLGGIAVNSETYSKTVEARRNCVTSLAEIATRVLSTSPELLSASMSQIYSAILSGLDDYAVDRRGDVGSWVRMASLRAIGTVSEALFSRRSDLTQFEDYLPPNSWYNAVGGILKQGTERLDNVRTVAGEQLMTLIWSSTIHKAATGPWEIPGLNKLEHAFPQDTPVAWSDGEWLFPKMAPLLDVENYRTMLLSGIVTSLGSRNESSQLPLAKGLCTYANSLPRTPAPDTRLQSWDLIGIVDAVLDIGRANSSSNTIMIPVLKTLDIFFEGDVLTRLCTDELGVKRLQTALDQAGKGGDRLKNVQRILGAMKVCVDFIALKPVARVACTYTEAFLGHRFPKVSADTAEALYFLTQTRDIGESEELEELLLETPWITLDDSTRKIKSEQTIALLRAMVESE